jgi:hypothetical protein
MVLQVFFLSCLYCSVWEGRVRRTGARGSPGPSGWRCWTRVLRLGALGRARRTGAAARGCWGALVPRGVDAAHYGTHFELGKGARWVVRVGQGQEVDAGRVV